eukprot:m.89512 g.89512  ORF g.89512 m.89512 type:complete len:97 (+) comp13226_c0_seq3:973-1263(+)
MQLVWIQQSQQVVTLEQCLAVICENLMIILFGENYEPDLKLFTGSYSWASTFTKTDVTGWVLWKQNLILGVFRSFFLQPNGNLGLGFGIYNGSQVP